MGYPPGHGIPGYGDAYGTGRLRNRARVHARLEERGTRQNDRERHDPESVHHPLSRPPRCRLRPHGCSSRAYIAGRSCKLTRFVELMVTESQTSSQSRQQLEGTPAMFTQ